ncbi:hypothetical protein [Halomonas sp. GFAJ-1]|uniref:hypothetical protein n=1 Tax=Halomonas sp. GFAJ-1 TaxID=1118153 RepID=UPI00130147E6|nr:hypothetical protein [Halomonas sp. GFAJ-1]
MLQVYKDFGDVRYEGCRYRAFAKWWRERVDTGETRGEYLFAEPKVEPAASRIVKEAEINAAIQCLDTIIISVNVKHQRQHIDAAISRILKRSLITTKGRKVRNPESSAARYHLPKSFNISALKKTFRVYELRIEGERSGKQITNYKIADMVGLSSKSDNIEIKDAAYENRKKSVQVSRHYRMANDIIDSVGCGGFVF